MSLNFVINRCYVVTQAEHGVIVLYEFEKMIINETGD